MSLLDTLQDTKNRLSALLAFANQKTGADDSSIGDAIKTLCDGFGGSGEITYGTMQFAELQYQISNAAVPVFSINIGQNRTAFSAVSLVPSERKTVFSNIEVVYGNQLYNGYAGAQVKTEWVALGNQDATYVHYDPSSGELTFTAELWRTVNGGLWIWAAM